MKAIVALACTSLLIGCVAAPDDGGGLELDVTEQPSICGSTNDAQHVNNYNGSLGPSVAFVQVHKGSKGALETSASDSASAKYCSGSLITSNLFLTAGHCVTSSTVGHYVAFNYERAAGSTSLLAQTHVRVIEVVEDSLGGLDYAILRLEGDPGSTWGISALAPGDATVGEAISIIGHPNAEPKQIEGGTVASRGTDYLYYGDLDTLGGSSGSGILNSVGQIVGVHTNGGCTATGGTNSGVRIARICAVSSAMSEACSSSDLIVRNSAGDLYLYPFQNDTFYGNGTQVGHGFNFTHYFVGNWTGNGTDDLIVRDSAGSMYLYPFRKGTFYGNGTLVGTGWNFTDYFVGNWTGDGTDDLIVRDSAGSMYLYPFRNGTFYGNGTLVGTGWNFTDYFVGNWTGDGTADLIVRDNAGSMYLYPFRDGIFYGNGTLVGTGWNFTDYFVGNWTGDGTDDLIVRDSAGTMYLYPFRNNTFYGNGTLVGTGWNFMNYFVDNWTGDGTDDFIVRDNAGVMYLYPFRNETFYGNGTLVGTGWNFTDYLAGNWSAQ